MNVCEPCVNLWIILEGALVGTQGSRSGWASPFPKAMVKPRESILGVLGRPRDDEAQWVQGEFTQRGEWSFLS